MPPLRKSFQLDPDKDAELIAWLTSFTNRYKMGDLIKLALYELAGIKPGGDLAQLQSPKDAPAQLSLFDMVRADDDDTHDGAGDGAAVPSAEVSAQFEAILQELMQLREALLARMAQEDARGAQPAPASPPRSAPPSTSDSPEPPRGEVQSSGIDMSRPRRPHKSKRVTAPLPDDPQEELLDPDALARELLRSIGSFGQDG